MLTIAHVVTNGALERRVGLVVGSHPGDSVLSELLAHLFPTVRHHSSSNSTPIRGEERLKTYFIPG